MTDNSDNSKRSESDESCAPGATQRRRKRRVGFYVFAIMLGLLPFILLEIGLRAFGVGEEAANADLHAGFGSGTPLFRKHEESNTLRTSLVKEQFFVPQTFAVDKPKDEFRIFCLGGSTVQGRPYLPETAFGKWLELELNGCDNTRTYNVINCGGISYASYRLQTVMDEVLTYEPDLILLATGHNEFLEDRTYSDLKSRSGIRVWFEDRAKSLRTVMLLRQLVGARPRQEPTQETQPTPEAVETRLDDTAGYASYHRDDEWHALVCDQYESSVRKMVTSCQRANVPLILLRLGSNLRDCPPFKSEHRSGLDVDKEQDWQSYFDDAAVAFKSDPQKALDLYRKAAAIDDQYPLLQFRMGRCLDVLDRFEEAIDCYRLAQDLDICPLRMCSELKNRLETIATQESVFLIDAETVVARQSPQSITGFESYIDHVHPTIKAHQEIGTALVDGIRKSGLLNESKAIATSKRRLLFRDHMRSLSSSYYSNGRRRIGWLEGWAQRTRLFEETLPVDLRGYIVTAVRDVDLHRFDTAIEHIQTALNWDESAGVMFVRESLSIFQQGRNQDARWLLETLQRHKLPKRHRQAVRLGLLVLAMDADDLDAMKEIHDAHSGEWQDIIANDVTGWATVLDGFAERIESM